MIKAIQKFIENTFRIKVFKKKYMSLGQDFETDLEKLGMKNYRIIFDVGANVGQTSIVFSKLFKNADIFAFEPVSSTFSELVKRLSNMSKLHCSQIAFGSQQEDLIIKLNKDKTSTVNSLKNKTFTNEDLKEKIHVKTIDQYLKENKIEHIDLLKIDTEGWEIEVLKGSSMSLENQKINSVLCEVGFTEVNTWNVSFDEVNSFLKSYGYWLCAIYDIQHKHVGSGWQYGNALWIRSSYPKNGI